MVFLLVTALLSAVVIFLGASLLEWIFKKALPKQAASLGHGAVAVATVLVATAAYLYVMTRPAVVGPYEQFTFENIGGQVIGGVLVVGLKLWTGRKTAEQQA